MTNPIRIQRKRTKGWRMPENTVYVGRPTKWGNPFSVKKWGRKEALARYRVFMAQATVGSHFLKYDGESHLTVTEYIQQELRGKNLACWCPLDEPCHADILLEVAND